MASKGDVTSAPAGRHGPYGPERYRFPLPNFPIDGFYPIEPGSQERQSLSVSRVKKFRHDVFSGFKRQNISCASKNKEETTKHIREGSTKCLLFLGPSFRN